MAMSFMSVTSCFSQLGRYLIDVVLSLVVLSLKRGNTLPLFLKEAQEAFLLALVEVQALQLNDEIRELLAYFAHVFGADFAQSGAGEISYVFSAQPNHS